MSKLGRCCDVFAGPLDGARTENESVRNSQGRTVGDSSSSSDRSGPRVTSCTSRISLLTIYRHSYCMYRPLHVNAFILIDNNFEIKSKYYNFATV